MPNHTRQSDQTPWRLFRPGVFLIILLLGVIALRTPSRAIGNGAVTGTLTRADGTTAVANASIILRTTNWSSSQWVMTASDGSFHFANVEAGTYIFEVSSVSASDGFRPDNQTITVTADQTTALGTVRLLAANVFCKVTRSDGTTPIANASVTVRTADWSISRYATTDASGNCQLAVQQLTDYIFEVYSSDTLESRPDNIPFTYTGGNIYRDGTNGSTLIMTVPAAIRGKVILPNGQAAQYANLDLADANGHTLQSTNTDIDGIFKMDSVPTATYTLRIRPPSSPAGLAAPDPLSLSLTKGTTNTTYLDTPITILNAVKTVSGRVTRSSNGAPITNANISLWQMNGGAYGYTQTDSNGYYSVLVGAGGTWQASVYPVYTEGTPADWTSTNVPNSVTFTLPAAQAETQTADFSVLTLSATLTGHVYLPNGTPATGTSLWVSAWGQGMGGNSGQIQSGGLYSFKLAPGTYSVSVYGGAMDYGAAEQTVTLSENETVTLNITLLERNAHITGTVRGTDGRALANQSCNAWVRRGSGWGWATTDNNGNFSMNVMPGSYLVSCSSGSGMNSSTSTSYVSTDPPQEVRVAANGTASVNFTFALADATLNIRLTDANGTTISTMWGWTEARKCNASSSAFHYGGLGNSLANGSGSLRVPAGCWIISASVPYGADFSASSATSQQVTIGSGETQAVTLTLLPNNATVAGSFRDTNGNILTSVNGSVFLSSAGGSSWQWVSVNAGTYSVRTAAGTWDFGCWVDPVTASQYYLEGTCESSVTAVANTTTTHDVTLRTADSTITIKTRDPNDAALPNALIRVGTSFGATKTVSYEAYGAWFRPETTTNQNGQAVVRVPAGTYFVSASLDTDLGYINPPRQAITVTAETPGDVTLTFQRPDATITGTVTENSLPYTDGVLVTATNPEGGYSETEVGSSGSYSLPVTGGDVWTVRAGADDSETTGLEDTAEPVSVPANGTVTANLELDTTTTLAPGVTTTFNTENQQSVTQPDGAQVTMPPNSLATQSTTVSFSIMPTVEQAPETATDNRVGPGYAIEAVPTTGQSAGQALTQLTGSITICLPYNETTLTAEGLQEADLTMKAWDETASTYSDLQSVVVNEAANQICATTDHLTTFAITAAPVESQASPPVMTPDLVELKTRDLVTLYDASGPTIAVFNARGKLVKRYRPFARGTAGTFAVTAADVDATVAGEEIIVWGTSGQRLPIRVFTIAGRKLGETPAGKGGWNAVTITNVNGDDTSELIAAETNSRVVSLYGFSGRKLKRLVRLPSPVGGAQLDILAGRLTSATVDQIALVPHNGSAITVYAVNPARHRAAVIASLKNVPLRADGQRVALADVLGTSLKEIVVWPRAGSERVRILGLNRRGRLAILTTVTVRSARALTLGDLDGNGKSDLIALTTTRQYPSVRLFSAKSTTSLSAKTVATLNPKDTNLSLATGDFDANGTTDLLVVRGNRSLVTLYTYQPKQKRLKAMTARHVGARSTTRGFSVYTTDLDGDGRREIVLPATNASSLLTILKLQNGKLVRSKQLKPAGRVAGPYALTAAGTD